MDSNLSRFNNIIEQFVTQLIDTYKTNKYFSNEFSIFLEKFKIIKKINPAKSIEAFLIYGYPHKDKIMSEDDDFFLHYDCNKHIDDNHSLMNSLKLKDLWKEETRNDIKKSIFKYFQVMVILSEKYVQDKI